MGELSIRRNRLAALRSFQQPVKAAKTSSGTGTAAAKSANSRAAVSVSDTLQQLMSRLGQASSAQEARGAMQMGEAALAEVKDGLSDMEELAEKAAGEGDIDRAALQEQLEALKEELGRILKGGADLALRGEDGKFTLPDWLSKALSGEVPDKEAILSALGLDASASPSELLAALSKLPIEDSTAGYLAALYLGSVIAGGGASGELDPALAAEGLRALLAALSQGMSPDEAVEELTGGQFKSLLDFTEQFTGGTAPGLGSFLGGLLLSGDGLGDLPSLMDLLAGGGLEGMDGMDMLLSLLGTLGLPELGGSAQPELAETPEAPMPQPEAASPGTAQGEAVELGTVEAQEPGAARAVLDPDTGALTLPGGEVTIQGRGEQAPGLRMDGQTAATLRQVDTSVLTAAGDGARVALSGENSVGELRLMAGTVLTIEGSGTLRLGELRGDGVLRITGGAVVLSGPAEGNVQVVVDGPASFIAPQGVAVTNAQGQPLEAFDILWKALFPDWKSLTGLNVDGRQGELDLSRGVQPDIARLWLTKSDSSHGYPAHRVLLQGRDSAGNLKTRYVYMRWDGRSGRFREMGMYPNPFSVTGGEADTDWRYDEESGVLRILTGEVTAIAGGRGQDANQEPFSGRVTLSDGIGQVELSLGGVDCRVGSGRAFSLGRGNTVTLILRRGEANFFESGPGCAGISLGEGTSLCIDQAGPRSQPDGALTATGGSNSAGIGRDGGAGLSGKMPIMIRGGKVKAIANRGIAAKAPGPEKPSVTMARFPISAQTLKLDALDISTRQAAEEAKATLSAGKRLVSRLQGAYRGASKALDKRQETGIRDLEEASGLLSDMCQELLRSSGAEAHSAGGMSDLERLMLALDGEL